MPAQQPFLLPDRARGGKGAGSIPGCSYQEAPMTQHKLELPGKCPNQDPACHPCQSRHLISKLWGRFWSAFAGGEGCLPTWPQWHGSIIPQPRAGANPALLPGFSSGLHRNPGTGHLQHRLFVFLQQSASDPSQALCLHM